MRPSVLCVECKRIVWGYKTGDPCPECKGEVCDRPTCLRKHVAKDCQPKAGAA